MEAEKYKERAVLGNNATAIVLELDDFEDADGGHGEIYPPVVGGVYSSLLYVLFSLHSHVFDARKLVVLISSHSGAVSGLSIHSMT